MDARKFLPIAERYRRSSDEAERRTSAGRSYYALFNVILAALSEMGVNFRGTAEDHQKLIAYMKKARSKAAASIADALKDLRKERNDADYHLNSTFNESRSKYAYLKACDALLQFDAIPAAEMASIVRIIQALP